MKTIGVFILLYIQFYILSSVFYSKVTEFVEACGHDCLRLGLCGSYD